jgi:hypothetical protein
MSTNTPPSLPVDPAFGPARRGLIRVVTILFVLLLIAMLALGTLLVALQLFALVTGDGQFVIDAEKTVGPWTYGIAAAFGTLTLVVALAHGWKSTD